MRKKVRKIVVDGIEYAWAIEETLWPTLVLKVWRGKGHLWFERTFDAGVRTGPVTPRDVAELVRAQLAAGSS